MCTSACLTKNHKTWGECARAKNLRIAFCRSAVNEGNDYTADKKWNRELDTYASIRAQGIQPESTNIQDIRVAEEVSNLTGEAYGSWEL